MNRFLSVLCVLTAILFSSVLGAMSPLCGHELAVGPSTAYYSYSESGGGDRSGLLYGVKGYYQRWDDCGLYLRAEGYHLQGDVSGRSAAGNAVESDYEEQWAAGAVGWSIGGRWPFPAYIVPYGIYGRYWSRNEETRSVDPQLETRELMHTGGAGFAARLGCSDCVMLGFDARYLVMWDGKNKTLNDPVFDEFYRLMGDEEHIYLALPVMVVLADGAVQLDLEFSPYYWYRHFGARNNTPRNYLDSHQRVYGCHLAAAMRF